MQFPRVLKSFIEKASYQRKKNLDLPSINSPYKFNVGRYRALQKEKPIECGKVRVKKKAEYPRTAEKDDLR